MSAVATTNTALLAAMQEIKRIADWAVQRGGKEDAAAVIEDIRNTARAALGSINT